MLSCDCRVTVPAFWTNTSQISFNFSGFQAAHPGQTLQYQWGIGTTPRSISTIPFTAFTGSEVPHTIFITNGQLRRDVTVFQQTYSLTNATALVEGQEYHVTVQAYYAGSASAAASSGSTTVKVSLLCQHASPSPMLRRCRNSGCSVATGVAKPQCTLDRSAALGLHCLPYFCLSSTEY